MSWPLTLTLALVAFFVVLVVSSYFDLRRQRELQRLMDGIITRRGQATLDQLAEMIDEHRYVLGRHHENARGLFREGRFEEAAERLALGCRAIEELAPDLLSALATLRRLARSVSVIVAVDPVSAYAFRVWELRGLAGAGQVLHHLLATGRQKIALRLAVVASALKLLLRGLRRATLRVAARPSRVESWSRVEALVADLGSTGNEALVAARQVVQALDALELDIPAEG